MTPIHNVWMAPTLLGQRNKENQVHSDGCSRRGGIVIGPNRPDAPKYILRLIGKVITVSLETVGIGADLPELSERVGPS